MNTFNRTSLELKLHCLADVPMLATFNRTSLELKLCTNVELNRV